MKIKKLEWEWEADDLEWFAYGVDRDYAVSEQDTSRPFHLAENGAPTGTFDTEEEAKEFAQQLYEQDVRYFISQHTEE